MHLKATQEYFSQALLKQDESTQPLFLNTLCHNPRISEQQALGIYRNNSLGVKIKALQEVYPVLKQVLGDSCFYQMAHDYVLDHPSMHYDLNQYGETFVDFIHNITFHNAAFSDLMYLSDLARLEWYLNAAYYAGHDMNDLTHLDKDADRIILTSSQSLGLLQSIYPVYEIWQGHQSNNKLELITALTMPQYLVIARAGLKADIASVEKEDWLLLSIIQKTINMQKLTDLSIKMEIELEKRLPKLIQYGWVCIQ